VKQAMASTEEEARWPPVLACILLRREESLASAGIQTLIPKSSSP